MKLYVDLATTLYNGLLEFIPEFLPEQVCNTQASMCLQTIFHRATMQYALIYGIYVM